MIDLKNTSVSNLFGSKLGVWLIRCSWIGSALIYRLGFGDATQNLTTSGASTEVVFLEAGVWFLWFIGLIAVWVSHPVALTTIRCIAPAAPASMVVAAILTGSNTSHIWLAFGVSAAVAAAIFTPMFGDPMINGSAYGPERRLALRPPAYLLIGPIQLLWLLMFAGLITGPLLLATSRTTDAEVVNRSGGQVAAGVVLSLAGGVCMYFGVQAVHKLARRWLVFVPAGFVIHDHLLMVEPILLPRKILAHLDLVRKSDRDEDAVDVTGGASGLTVEATLQTEISLAMRTFTSRPQKGKGAVEVVGTRQVRFTPTLPGLALSEARVRGFRIGKP